MSTRWEGVREGEVQFRERMWLLTSWVTTRRGSKGWGWAGWG